LGVCPIFLDELVLIKGITPDLFQIPVPEEKLSDASMLTDAPIELSQYISIYGLIEEKKKFTFPGKININTAELPIIAALLPDEDVFFAPSIYEYRNEMLDSKYINDLSKLTWYKQAPGCSDLKIDDQLITNSSDFFRIECDAKLDDESFLRTTAVIERTQVKNTGKYTCKVLSWQYD